jgi:hypothetical protein
MKATFIQITDSKDISEKDGFGKKLLLTMILLGISLIMILVLRVHPLVTGVILILLIFFGESYVRRYYGDYARKEDKKGELTFLPDSISWGQNDQNKVLNTKDMASINLKYNYIQGQQFAYKDIIHNGLAHMKIETLTNETLSVKFLIETKAQLDALKPIWAEYYRAGIRIRESMGKYDVKTILFDNANASYEQIQRLKKELNTDHFH